MMLPYLLRLLCLCIASFFVLNAAAGLLLRCASRSVVRRAASNAPADAARFLFALRMLPAAFAAFFVLGFCVPSYLWLEPAATSERVGAICAALGLIGAATWILSIGRIARSLFASSRYNRLCRRQGQKACLPGSPSPAVLVETEAPLLAMSGLFRPRLLISRGVLRSLSPEELAAALHHEHAHLVSRDNSKRLLFLLVPDLLPFVAPFRLLESQWSKFTEWAADDQAAAGDSSRAISLAAALVRVARMGSAPRLPHLSTSLLACDRDLSARVARLLAGDRLSPAQPSSALPLFGRSSYLLAACLGFVLLSPMVLSPIHQLLERFLQ